MSRIIGTVMVIIALFALLATVGAAAVGAGEQVNIFMTIISATLCGVICAFLGGYLLTMGSPLIGLPLPNRAYRVLSVEQFKEDGLKHLLLVPWGREDETPIYRQLSPKRTPDELKAGDIIIRVGRNPNVKVLFEKKSPDEEQTAP